MPKESAMQYSLMSRDICKHSGLSSTQLRNWIVRGLVVPSVPACGRGSPSRFTREKADQVAAMARMVSDGYRPRAAAEKSGADREGV